LVATFSHFRENLRARKPYQVNEQISVGKEREHMIDVLVTATVIVAVGYISYAIGRQVGYEKAQAEIRGRRRLAGAYD
jgi:hypothetical protein